MLKNIFLELQYKGANYFGFQIQNQKSQDRLSIQEVLEKVLESLFGLKLRIEYASRTDRGVNALAQAVNFKVDSKIPLENIKRVLNSRLPEDIRVKKIKYVPLDFHSRFKAVSKIYRYIILNKKEPSVFHFDLAWHIPEKLDIPLMQKASKFFIGKKDFSVFAKESKRYKDCVREIKSITIKKKGNFIYIEVEGDGFLRSMVRNITSLLVEVGKKKIKVKAIEKIILGQEKHVNNPALGSGLYLVKVNY